MVEIDDVKGIFQTELFYDPMPLRHWFQVIKKIIHRTTL